MIRIKLYNGDLDKDKVLTYEADIEWKAWENYISNTVTYETHTSIEFFDKLTGKHITITPKNVALIEAEEIKSKQIEKED